MSSTATLTNPAMSPGKTVRTAVAGVSGYAGGELARLLLAHPRLQGVPPLLLGRMAADAPAAEGPTLLSELHPQLSPSQLTGEIAIVPFDWNSLRHAGIELLFLATPHEQAREWVPQALAHGIRVVDLSAAWRLNEAGNRAIYKLEDADPALAASIQAEAIYGCPELHRAEIAHARLVANPGCYATSIILALAPLLRAGLVDVEAGIICDSKSGVSGAGKTPSAKTHFMYGADNLSLYAVFNHRHRGEMLEQLGLAADQIQFTPHLLPIPRGILSTIYLRLKDKATVEQIQQVFRSFYATSPLVRVRQSPALPTIQHIVRTNYCDLGFELGPNGRQLVLVSCLDNLLKGAAGQAVQNMNLMCGFKEEEGLL
jgi:N-acetyl-gamma-glutamyl-phosphate reductase